MIQVLLGLMLVSDINPGVGTTGYNFLKVAPTAREAAMGNAAVGFSDDAFGIWYNPAGIVQQTAQQFGLGYISYVGGVQSGAISYVNPIKDKVMGLGVYYLNSGTMKKTDEMGNELGTFGASYLDLNAAGGMKLMADKLALGAGLKVLYGRIDTFWTAGIGVDLAASYLLTKGLRGSLVARNIGFSAKAFEATHEKLPMDFALGFGYDASSTLRLSLEGYQPLDDKFEVRAGAELWVSKFACLRAGLTTAGSDLKDGGGWDLLAGVSAGLGVHVKMLELDYAYTPMVILGNVHRISLRYDFR